MDAEVRENKMVPRRWASLARFAAGLAFALFVVYVDGVASPTPGEERKRLFVAFCSLTVAAFLTAYVHRHVLASFLRFLSHLSLSSVTFLTIAALELDLPGWWFWVALVTWAVLGALIFQDGHHGWSAALLAVAGAWSVATFVMSAGQIAFLPYSREQIAQLRSIHMLLDFRVSLAVLFLLLLVFLSFTRCLTAGAIRLGEFGIPLARVNESSETSLRILKQFAALLLNLILIPVNQLVRALALLVLFLFKVSREAIRLLRELFSEPRIVRILARIYASFVGVVVLSKLSLASASRVTEYINAGFWESLNPLGFLASSFLAAFLVTLSVRVLMDDNLQGVSDHHLGAIWVFAVLFVGGVVLEALVWAGLWPVDLPLPGAFVTLVLAILVLGGLVAWRTHKV